MALLEGPCAWARGGGEFAPSMELGTTIHTGDTGKSLTGSFGYFIAFRAERRRGFFRTFGALELQSAVGQASIGAAEPQYTLFGSGFVAGIHLVPFEESRFSTFMGGSGIGTWHMLKLPSPPAGVEPNTQGLSFGYEVAAGVDIRTGAKDGNALRVRTAFWFVTSTLAGVGGFQLNGFRLSLGIVW